MGLIGASLSGAAPEAHPSATLPSGLQKLACNLAVPATDPPRGRPSVGRAGMAPLQPKKTVPPGQVGRKTFPSHLFRGRWDGFPPSHGGTFNVVLHLALAPAPATSFGSCRRRIVVTLVSTILVPTANHPRQGRLLFRVCEPMHFGGPPHLPSHHFETRWDVPPLNWDVLSGTGFFPLRAHSVSDQSRVNRERAAAP
jgi:hypothetical protein